MERNETVIEVTNGSLSPQEAVQGDSHGFRITKIFFYVLILSASTVGNSMVATIIARKMRTASNFLILNLAICDLLTPLISIVFDFVLEENSYVWLYGDFMCKLLWPAQTYFTCASSLTLAAISLDRYRLIMHPFKTRLSMKQIRLMIFFTHAFSLVAVSPYMYVLTLKGDSCEENWSAFTYRQTYTFFLFLLQYALPLIFMVIMYGLAVRALYNTSALMRGNSINSNTSRSQVERNIVGGRQRCKISKRQAVIKRIGNITPKIGIWSSPNAKAMKIFIVVVVVFTIFMFPNQVVWLWADFGGGIRSPNFTNISIVCWLFTYTNCVVNPVILGVFSKDFRKGFKKMFKSIMICFQDTSPKLKGVKVEVKRIRQMVSGSLFGGESPAIESNQCNRFLAVHDGQQLTSLANKANKDPLRVPYVSESSNDYDMYRTVTETFTSFTPDFEHLPVTPDEQCAEFPYSLSQEHLKDAFNNSPETDC